MQVGRTGIEIKRAAESRASAEGIDLLVYSHVQGYWVHDAGMWAIYDWPERYGDHARITLKEGDWITLNGTTGKIYTGKLPLRDINLKSGPI